jgi:hypothetical protein
MPKPIFVVVTEFAENNQICVAIWSAPNSRDNVMDLQAGSRFRVFAGLATVTITKKDLVPRNLLTDSPFVIRKHDHKVIVM